MAAEVILKYLTDLLEKRLQGPARRRGDSAAILYDRSVPCALEVVEMRAASGVTAELLAQSPKSRPHSR